MFDEDGVGILNCESFEKNSEIKKLFEGFSCGTALIDSKIIDFSNRFGSNSHSYKDNEDVSPNKSLV
jgi:hypothetical protein